VFRWDKLAALNFPHLPRFMTQITLLLGVESLIFQFFSPVALRPNAGHGFHIHEVSRSHTTTHHSRYDSSGRVIGSSQRPVPDNTQHSQQTDIHAPGGIRNHDLSWRAAADLRLRPRGCWDRLSCSLLSKHIDLDTQNCDQPRGLVVRVSDY